MSLKFEMYSQEDINFNIRLSENKKEDQNKEVWCQKQLSYFGEENLKEI